MSVFRHREKTQKPRSKMKKALFGLCIVLLLLIFSAFMWFRSNTQAYDSSDTTVEVVVINPGASEASISKLLESRGLIKSSLAYQIYARVNGAQGKAQAGSYELSPSLSVSDIVNKLINGDISVQLLTILPAQRISQLREHFISEGYFEEEVDEALHPDNYKDHPVLADKPLLSSLEGYLSPESFQYTDTTPLRAIVELSLDQTLQFFTPAVKKGLKQRGLDMHEAIILASIVEKEVSKAEDKPTVAQVFLTRLDQNISLGSDVTAHYGASLLGLEESVRIDTAYNTRFYPGLPPGPISNVTASSLQAIASPSSTDYIFFVAGDDGVTYFSRTIQEHEALVDLHCTILCQLP